MQLTTQAVLCSAALLLLLASARCDAQVRRLIYHMRDGNLYYCTIDGLSAGDEVLLASGGWSGQLAFDNGYLYRLSNDELRAIPVRNDAGTDLGPSISIGQGGWGGDNGTFAVNNQYVYLMKGDHLYGANLRVSNALHQLRPEGGWHGYVAVADGYLFLQRDGDLFVTKADGLNVQDLHHVDNGGGYRDGPIAFYQSNGYLYHMAPSDNGWNLYARNIDAASAHLGGDAHGLHAVNWYGAMAIGTITTPPPVKWWQKVESDYMDQYGLVRDRPRSEWDPSAPGDNDLLWTSWYYLARRLSPDGDWDDSLIDQFNRTVRQCQDQPGLFFRHPEKREYTAFDDYFGLATASYICDPQRSVARDIFQYGLTHGGGPFPDFVYGSAGSNTRTLWARPWVISFLGIVTNEPGRLSLGDRTATDADFIGDVTVGTDVMGLTQPGTENPAFAWMQLRVENDPNTPAGALGIASLRGALHGYKGTFDNLFPDGMAGALAHWSSGWAMHPLHEGFEGVQ